MKRQIAYLAAVLLVALGVRAFGDFSATQGAGTTIFSFTCFSTKVCTTATPVNSAGTEIGTAAVPVQVSLANTAANAAAVAVGQTTASLLNATVVGTGTFAVQASPSTATLWGLGATGAAVPANAHYIAINSGGNLTGWTGAVTNAGTFAVQASVPTWAGGTLGAMANYGTSPGAVLVPGVNAFVTNSNANGQTTSSASSPVVLASDQSVADPCTFKAKTNFTVSTQTGTTQLVAPSGATQVYICSFAVVSATAVAVNLVGGTGAACTTGTPVGILGAATAASAASGASLAANGGLTFGNGGSTVLRTTTNGHGVCLIQSGTAVLGGGGTYVQQ